MQKYNATVPEGVKIFVLENDVPKSVFSAFTALVVAFFFAA